MRNRISCSALELGQLDPDMVESVVGGQVFKIGNQYFSDKRVNIVEANGTQVVAEVNGTYGVYAQTIKLRGGTLSTKCSCPSTEQPFCRHCVAVLLQQFHSGPSLEKSSKKSGRSVSSPPPPKSEPSSQSSASTDESSSTVDLNFREATLFIDWIQQVVGQLGKEPSLAEVPKPLVGVARDWAGMIDRLNQKFIESEEDRNDAQRNLQSAENMVDSLKKELGTVTEEAESAQQSCHRLEKQVKQLEEALKDFSQISNERDRLVGKVSTMQSELQSKGAELESVSMTLKSLSNAIRNLLPTDPS